MEVDLGLPVAAVEDDETWGAISRNLYWVDRRIENIKILNSEQGLVRIVYAGESVPRETLKSIENATAEILRLYKRVSSRTLFTRGRQAERSGSSPLTQLVESGSAKLINGAIEATDILLSLMRGLDREFSRLARGLKATEYEFPSTLSLDLAKRCGVLDNFPHHTYFINNLISGDETVRNLRATAAEDLPNTAWQRMLCAPTRILAPAVCYHYWGHSRRAWSGDKDLDIGTAVGKCYRFERPQPSTWDRLSEFRMREIFAVGSSVRMKEIRLLFQDYLKDLLTRFDLEGDIQTAFDSFYLDQYASKRMYQLGFEVKLELCSWLPFQKRKIALASVNDHRDFFTKEFEVTGRDGIRAESCCLAFGLERVALAILEQHGVEPQALSAELRRLVDEQ